MQRAYSLLAIKSVDDARREIVGIATTPEPDRLGDIVEPKGAQFKLPIPLLWQHRADQPLGHVVEATVRDDGIHIRAVIAKGLDLPWIEQAYTLIKSGLVRGLSIGFKPIESSEIKGTWSEHITKWLWLETSAVTIPANASATIALVKSCDTPSPASGSGGRVPRRAASGARPDGFTMNVSEELTQKRTILTEKTTQIGELLTLDTLTAEQLAQRTTLTMEIRGLNGDIESLEVLENAQAHMAQPVVPRSFAAPPRQIVAPMAAPVVQVKDNLPPGQEYIRYLMCRMHAYIRNGEVSPIDVAKSWYPDHPRIQLAFKAAVAAGTTAGATWASPLVYAETLASEFLEYLRPMTIIGRIEGLRRVPFNVRIAAQTSGGTGYWVGQGLAKPVTKFDFTSSSLGFAKVAAISVITEELARFSSPNAEALVRQGLIDCLQARLDTDFIDPDKAAVSGVSPASITNGISALTDSADSETDIKKVFDALATANISPAGGHWIMPEQVATTLAMLRNALGQVLYPTITPSGGTLVGYPVVTSQYASAISGSPAVNVVIFVVPREIYLSDDGGFDVSVSREASIEMDSAPVGDSGTPTAGSSSVVSMWQTNSLALRAERMINWSRRRAAAVQYFTGVTWTT